MWAPQEYGAYVVTAKPWIWKKSKTKYFIIIWSQIIGDNSFIVQMFFFSLSLLPLFNWDTLERF